MIPFRIKPLNVRKCDRLRKKIELSAAEICEKERISSFNFSLIYCVNVWLSNQKELTTSCGQSLVAKNTDILNISEIYQALSTFSFVTKCGRGSINQAEAFLKKTIPHYETPSSNQEPVLSSETFFR